jgi:hypothetical protein
MDWAILGSNSGKGKAFFPLMTPNQQNAQTSLFSVVTLLSIMHGMNNRDFSLPHTSRPAEAYPASYAVPGFLSGGKAATTLSQPLTST